MSEELEKYITQVESSKIPLSKKEIVILETDFETPSKNYWKSNFPECLESYNTGEMSGKFSKNDLSLNTVFDKINTLIKEVSVIALRKKGQTSEQIKDSLELIKLNLKVISGIIKDDNLTEDDVKYLYSFMHGFINSTLNIQKRKQ